MELKDYRDKLTIITDKHSKAEGAIEQMMIRLKDEYEVDSTEDAEIVYDNSIKEIDLLKEKRQVLVNKLDTLADWSNI